MNIEAMLKHARKQMQQRSHKPLPKHASETMKPSALTQWAQAQKRPCQLELAAQEIRRQMRAIKERT